MNQTSHQQKLKTYRLSESEYGVIKQKMGRDLQGIEWALFSALWSEHCSYKSSKVHLKKLFRNNARVMESEGENAGIIDLGEGEKIAFKMESHNHPSFIEPYQGAATGVGGILRDIFTMGARPIALANYLCFGEPNAPRMPELVRGVVAGIGGYGNCVGVPTLTGQTEFHESYNENILVNAMAVGLFGPNDPIVLSKSKKVGAIVVYAGAKTGRDGVHGASMASESFDSESESKRPTIQVGDPFLEKLLIEACLEVMSKNLVLAIQDMGAAGLTSSSFEMASKSELGMELDLSRVPLRDSTMSPEDILLSESQERMLMVCEPQHVDAIAKVFAHWGLDACAVGKVIETPVMRILWRNEVLTQIAPEVLVDQAPQYERPWTSDPNQAFGIASRTATSSGVASGVTELMSEAGVANRASVATLATANSKKSPRSTLEEILKTVQASRRAWIYEQYDQRVQANTVRDCAHSVGVLRLPHSGRYLGLVLGCRPYLVRASAAVGGADAILYPALELALKGFETLAVTDCLNFGNPEKPEVMGSFVDSLRALSQACEHLNAPIISGNVSFYNETHARNITPTPSTGVIGLAAGELHLPDDTFHEEGERVYLVLQPQFLGMQNDESSWRGHLNVEEAAKWIHRVRDLIRSIPVVATRAVGKFGIGYALTKMASSWGGQFSLDAIGIPGLDWTTEIGYAGLISVAQGRAATFKEQAEQRGLVVYSLGAVEGTNLDLKGNQSWPVSQLQHQLATSWEAAFEELA